MFRYGLTGFVLLVLGGFAGGAALAAHDAAGPLVDAEWVAEHACDDGIVVLDLRPSPGAFKRGHIACSVNSSLMRGWYTRRDGIPALLPDPADLAALIGGLGIGNDDHVVVVGPGGNALAATVATRAYWTFKYLGHDAVSILDGGFAAFRSDPSLPLEAGDAAAREARTFAPALRPELLATAEDVNAALEEGAATALIDSRTSDYYAGINTMGIVARPGTLPGADNVPVTWLTTPDGRFQSPEVLDSIAEHTPLDGETPLITFCNAGQMASLDWFVAHELLGNSEARMYDGSLTEWAADSERPLEQRVSVQ